MPLTLCPILFNFCNKSPQPFRKSVCAVGITCKRGLGSTEQQCRVQACALPPALGRVCSVHGSPLCRAASHAVRACYCFAVNDPQSCPYSEQHVVSASHLGLIRTCACVYVDGCPYMCERMCECVSTDIRVRVHICAVLHVHTHTRLYADVQVCTCLRVWM